MKRGPRCQTEEAFQDPAGYPGASKPKHGGSHEPEGRGLGTLGGTIQNAFGRTSVSQSILNLVNCILGASILGYPYCFKSSGMLLATLIMFVSLVACRFSFQLLLYASQLSSRKTYEDLAEQGMGRVGRFVVDFCTAAINLGSIVAYLNILADIISSVAGTLIPPGAEPSRNTYLIGVTLTTALPVALIVREHQLVATFSSFSIAFIVLFAVVVLALATLPPTEAVASTVLHIWRPDGLLVSFSVMAYSFTAHPYYLGIYNNLATATPTRMLRVTDLSMLLAASLYWIVGASGYLTFRGRTAGDLLRNFGGAHHKGMRGAYERALKLCYGLSILGSVPLVILPFYNIIMPLVSNTHMMQRAAAGSRRSNKQRLSDDEGDTPRKPSAASSLTPRLSLKSHNSGSISHTQTTNTNTHSTTTTDAVVAVMSDRARAPLAPRPAAAGGDGSSGGGAGAGVCEEGGAGVGGGGVSLTRHESGGGGSKRGVHGLTHAMSTDVVDIKMQQDGIHGAHGADTELMATPYQHAVVVTFVLGVAMASALWVPNVEFIFGLTGATASIVIAYVMPALTFIRLLDASPHLTARDPSHSGGSGGGGAGGLKCGGPHSAASTEVARKWVWRRRKAMLLLCFGIIAGLACTDAILSAVQEEATVVSLTQKLVAQKATIEEATRAHQRAQEAAAAVTTAVSVSADITAASTNTTSSLGKLQAAADALSAMSRADNAQQETKGWGIAQAIKDHKHHVAERKVLTGVEQSLLAVIHDITDTRQRVAGVVAQLDAAMTGIQTQQGQTQTTLTTGSAKQNVGSPSGARAPQSAAYLAAMLDKALGRTGTLGAGGEQGEKKPDSSAAKSLAQVRNTATLALNALDESMEIVQEVLSAVSSAASHASDTTDLRQAAMDAIQKALRATSSSALALNMTSDALSASATEETRALVTAITAVTADLQRTTKTTKSTPTPSPIPTPSPTPSPAAVTTLTSTTSALSPPIAQQATANTLSGSTDTNSGVSTVTSGTSVGSVSGPVTSTDSTRKVSAGGSGGSSSSSKAGRAADAVVGGGGAAVVASADPSLASPAPTTTKGQPKARIGPPTLASQTGITQGQGQGQRGQDSSSTDVSTGSGSGTLTVASPTVVTVSVAAVREPPHDVATAALKKAVADLKGALTDSGHVLNETALSTGGAATAGGAAGAATAGAAADGAATPATVSNAASSGTSATNTGAIQATDTRGTTTVTSSGGSSGSIKGSVDSTGTGAVSTSSDTPTAATSSGVSGGVGSNVGIHSGSVSSGGATSGVRVDSAAQTSGAAASGAAPVAAAGAAGVAGSDVTDAIRDAVTLAQGTQTAVMKTIQDTLGKANTKVQERVVDLLKEIDETKQAISTANAKTRREEPPPTNTSPPPATSAQQQTAPATAGSTTQADAVANQVSATPAPPMAVTPQPSPTTITTPDQTTTTTSKQAAPQVGRVQIGSQGQGEAQASTVGTDTVSSQAAARVAMAMTGSVGGQTVATRSRPVAAQEQPVAGTVSDGAGTIPDTASTRVGGGALDQQAGVGVTGDAAPSHGKAVSAQRKGRALSHGVPSRTQGRSSRDALSRSGASGGVGLGRDASLQEQGAHGTEGDSKSALSRSGVGVGVGGTLDERERTRQAGVLGTTSSTQKESVGGSRADEQQGAGEKGLSPKDIDINERRDIDKASDSHSTQRRVAQQHEGAGHTSSPDDSVAMSGVESQRTNQPSSGGLGRKGIHL